MQSNAIENKEQKEYVQSKEVIPKSTILVNNGLKKAHEGKYDEAIIDFTQAIGLYPQYYNIHYYRGAIYKYLSKYNEAIIDFTQTIKLNSKFSIAYAERGSAYYEIGNYNEAFKDLNKSIKLNPKNFYAYNYRGHANMRIRNLIAAKDDFFQVINLNNSPRNLKSSAICKFNECGEKIEAALNINISNKVDQTAVVPSTPTSLSYNLPPVPSVVSPTSLSYNLSSVSSAASPYSPSNHL